ncbi:MAG: hypothetical protein FWF56_01700 [Firmicutes bacterium]|nr:hypothetical protein [Bacillota bacterium]
MQSNTHKFSKIICVPIILLACVILMACTGKPTDESNDNAPNYGTMIIGKYTLQDETIGLFNNQPLSVYSLEFIEDMPLIIVTYNDSASIQNYKEYLGYYYEQDTNYFAISETIYMQFANSNLTIIKKVTIDDSIEELEYYTNEINDYTPEENPFKDPVKYENHSLVGTWENGYATFQFLNSGIAIISNKQDTNIPNNQIQTFKIRYILFDGGRQFYIYLDGRQETYEINFRENDNLVDIYYAKDFGGYKKGEYASTLILQSVTGKLILEFETNILVGQTQQILAYYNDNNQSIIIDDNTSIDWYIIHGDSASISNNGTIKGLHDGDQGSRSRTTVIQAKYNGQYAIRSIKVKELSTSFVY